MCVGSSIEGAAGCSADTGRYLIKNALTDLPDGIQRYNRSSDISLAVREEAESSDEWTLTMEDHTLDPDDPVEREVTPMDCVQQRSWEGPVPPPEREQSPKSAGRVREAERRVNSQSNGDRTHQIPLSFGYYSCSEQFSAMVAVGSCACSIAGATTQCTTRGRVNFSIDLTRRRRPAVTVRQLSDRRG